LSTDAVRILRGSFTAGSQVLEQFGFTPEESADIKQQLGFVTTPVFAAASTNDYCYWLNGGLLWRFTKKLSLGVDVRYTDADATIETTSAGHEITGTFEEFKVDSGGTHAGVLFGFHR